MPSPPAVNVIAQVGHASLRVSVMDSFDRAATNSEIGQMKDVLRRYYGRDERVFETSVSLHPQDRFTYKLTFANELSIT